MRHAPAVAQHAPGLLLVGFLLWIGCAGMQSGTSPAASVRAGYGAAGEIPPGRLYPQALPTGAASHRLAPNRTPTALPTVTPTLRPEPRAGPLVWIGGEGCLTVLGPSGWRRFPLEGIVRDIAVDAAGNAIVAPGLRVCDGGLLRALQPPAPGGEQDAVAVDPQGRIWVAYYGGIAVLEEGAWRQVPIAGPGIPDKARLVRDLVCDPHGGLWLGTAAGLARFDGRAWEFPGESAGPAASPIDCLMIDPEGRLWVSHEKGLSVLQGNTWTHFPPDVVSYVRAMAIDAAGHILAGSLYHGLTVFDGHGWSVYADQSSGLPSNRITALAVDAFGRIWAGTRQGLSVYDGQRWLTYQEANSGLGDNQISALALRSGALDSLPAPSPLPYGRVEGRVTRFGSPAGGIRVVLCSELSLVAGLGDQPCEDIALRCQTRTAPDGRYAFERVPPGHYAVAAEVDPGRWVTHTRLLTAIRYPVRAGETTSIETIEGAG